MLNMILRFCKTVVMKSVKWVEHKLQQWTKPATASSGLEIAKDVLRSKSELVVENAFLRQQVIILQRQVERPKLTNRDRRLLVLLASRLRTWRQALRLVKPETLLQWHRDLFKLVWRRKSAVRQGRPPLAPETIALIRQMARENPLWGAERIRGELLKLALHVAKRTIQKYIRQVRPPRPFTQTWRTFLRNHAQDIWACDFLPVINFFFRQYYVFFIVELASRRVVHFGVTDSPTDAWTAQQLREAMPFGQAPKYLIRDNDSKYGATFARVAAGAGIKVLKTPVKAPNANAICERFLRSVRRECLDHFFVLSQRHLSRILKAYVAYFNQERPHQGLAQQIPIPTPQSSPGSDQSPSIQVLPVLGGLHHMYRRAA
jgi:transposase InsO family protein